MRTLTYSNISTKGLMYILHNMEPNWLNTSGGHTVSSQIANCVVNMNFHEKRAIETAEKISAYISTQWGPAVGRRREIRIIDCIISEEDVEILGIGQAKSNFLSMSVPFEKDDADRVSIIVKQLGVHHETGAGEVYTNEKLRSGQLKMMPSGMFSVTLRYPDHDYMRIARLATNLLFSHLHDIFVTVDLPSRNGLGEVTITNKALAALTVFSIAYGASADGELGAGGVILDMAMDQEI
jgi:hypothetical protein